MTERLTSQHEATPRLPQWSNQGLGPKRTMLVMVVVVGCFAVLWPKIFYPMLMGNANSGMRPGPEDRGCCDVISEVDVDTIKIMSELCKSIIDRGGNKELKDKEIVIQCRKAVLETCGIDISDALHDRISLGQSTKQILEEVRSLNGTMCLQYHFGVSPWKLGVGHRVNVNTEPANSIRQERPAYIRPGAMHPAFRERGRAIPETGDGLPRRAVPPKIVEGRPGPIPGIRPAMGGQGIVHPKQHTQGLIGILMPVYTIIIVIFFTYTCIRLASKKKTEMSYEGAPLYPPCDTDDDFRKEVFDTGRPYFDRPYRDSSKIVVNAVAALLEEVNIEIEAHKNKTPPDPASSNTNQERLKPNGSLAKEEDQSSVTVLGMVTTASAESGKKWSRPDSPVLPHMQQTPKESSPPPQQIFLDTPLPPQSQILVADLEAQKDSEDDCPVVLAGKMTLSVISLDSEDSSSSGRREDEERRTSSSNVSEEFEKINAADLEEQIENMIEQGVAMAEDMEELSPLEIARSEREEDDVFEEIKRQLQVKDDLLKVLQKEEQQIMVEGDSKKMELEDLINMQKHLENILFEEPPRDEGVEKGGEIVQQGKALTKETSHMLREEEKEPEAEISVMSLLPDTLDTEESSEEVCKRVIETSQDSQSDTFLSNEKQLEKTLFDESSHELQEEPMEPEARILSVNLVPDSPKLQFQYEEALSPEKVPGNDKNLNNKETLAEAQIDTSTLELTALLDIQKQLEKALFEVPKEDVEAENQQEKEILEEASHGLQEEAKKAESENSVVGLIPDLLGNRGSQVEALGYEISEDVVRQSSDVHDAGTVKNFRLRNESLSEEIASNETNSAANKEVALASQTDLLSLDLNTVVDVQKQLETSLSKDSPEAEKLKVDVPLEADISGDESQKTSFKESFTENDMETKFDAAEEEVKESSSSCQQTSQVTQDALNDGTLPSFELPQEVFQALVLRESPEKINEEPNNDEASVSKSPLNLRIYQMTEPSVEQILRAELGRNSEDKSQTDTLLQGLSIRTEEASSEEDDVDENLDVVEQIIEEIHYETDEEDLNDEQERVNGVGTSEGSSRNGAETSETVAENDISENELVNDDDEEDEEIEEIIEYVDNTDEEGEEIIEVNGNERYLNNSNQDH